MIKVRELKDDVILNVRVNKSFYYMAKAASFVVLQSMNIPEKGDEYFKEVMSMATTHGQAFWENMMLANIDNRSFNSRIAEIALRGQYPDDYKDRQEIKAQVKQEVTVDFNKEIAELISALKE